MGISDDVPPPLPNKHTNVQNRRSVNMLSTHHLSDSFQRGDDHRLLPILEVDELSGKAPLQRNRCFF